MEKTHFEGMDYEPTEQEIRKEKELMDKMYAELDKYYKEEKENNLKILLENKIPDIDFKRLTDCCDVGKLEIVSKSEGTNQDEKCGIFKSVYVDQWSVGMEGDSFEGYIYGKLDKGKWLKVPYSC